MNDLTATKRGWAQIVAGVTSPVSAQTYAATGFGLMALKYAVEATVAWLFLDGIYTPWAFFSPVISFRAHGFDQTGIEQLTIPYLLWTLPFAWIGASMTVRRFRDAGLPGLFGLVFFVPLVNLLVMLGLCVLPTQKASPAPALPEPTELEKARPHPPSLAGPDRVLWASLTGVAAGTAVGVAALGLSVFGLGDYGGALFLGAPVMMGTVAGFLLNVGRPRSLPANVGVAVLTCITFGGLLLLTALEGLICIAMAAPIGLAMTSMGVLLGRALATVEGGRMVRLMGLGWPALLLVEPPAGANLREVSSRVVIHAPPEAVWEAVIGFGDVELPPPPEWFFQLGIAYPMRARIQGTPVELGGDGAIRYCEFSTGPFVEPIQRWAPPVNGGSGHLAFSVSRSPPTMHEWSFYDNVHAPHLDGILQSRRGEFVIQPLGGGDTLLIGRTWYTFDMAPEPYWGLWSDAAIHEIHDRVLEHIRGVAEGAG